MQFEDKVYQKMIGIPMGTNCAPVIADLFFYCYEKDFMSYLHKSKKLDLVAKFYDTSRYFDDTVPITLTVRPLTSFLFC